MNGLYGGIEAGGNKYLCAVGTGPDDLQTETTIPTTSPDETISQVIAFFRQHAESLKAIGIGSFGPVDLNPTSPAYGHITTTPKAGWENTNVAGLIQRALGVPVLFDTDVNAAALGEQRWGVAQGLDTFIYLTVGTGIGGGGMVNGQLMHGLVHPEMGHIRVPHNWDKDAFPGICSYHGDCLEGLASGPALERRWLQPPETLPPDHPAWELEAEYLAFAVVNFIYILSPQRIIIGGGVMKQEKLLPLVRENVRRLLNNYALMPEITGNLESYIVLPGLGQKAGVLGAIALAQTID
jgi:fructokinase